MAFATSLSPFAVVFDVPDGVMVQSVEALLPHRRQGAAGGSAPTPPLLRKGHTDFVTLDAAASSLVGYRHAPQQPSSSQASGSARPMANSLFFRASRQQFSGLLAQLPAPGRTDADVFDVVVYGEAGEPIEVRDAATTAEMAAAAAFRFKAMPNLRIVSQLASWAYIGHLSADDDDLRWTPLGADELPSAPDSGASTASASAIDHVALAVEQGTAYPLALAFSRLFGFHRFVCGGEDDSIPDEGLCIRQGDQGMRMFTLLHTDDAAFAHHATATKRDHPSDFYLAIVEPLEGRKGQVHDFVVHHGANVQHVALRTDDIVERVDLAASSAAVGLVRAPAAAAERSLAVSASYPQLFDMVVRRSKKGERLSHRDAAIWPSIGTCPMRSLADRPRCHLLCFPLDALTRPLPASAAANPGILAHARVEKNVDLVSDDDVGLLSQMFTQQVHPNAEIFFELIERRNYRGFAPANIGGLFSSKAKGKEIIHVLYVDEMLGAQTMNAWTAETLESGAGVAVDLLHLDCRSEEELVRYLQSTSRRFDVVVSSFVPISERVLAAIPDASRPKLVQAQGIGYNHVDLAACRRRGIAMANNADWCTTEVAEYCLSTIVARCGRLEAMDCRASGIGWQRDPEALGRHSLSAYRLLLVGAGSIGGKLADLAGRLGIQVDVYDVAQPETCVEPLEERLGRADFVSLHVPLNDSTHKLFDQRLLGCMKKGAWLVNTARGGVVDEKALDEAIRSGRIAGATVDVFEHEPLRTEDPLYSNPDVICTPHIAGLTQESQRKACQGVIENIQRLQRGGARACARLILEPPTTAAASDSGSGSSTPDIASSISGSRRSSITPATSDAEGTPDTSAAQGGEAPMKTMRDIFDTVNQMRLRDGIDVANLSAGMVEVEPPKKLLELAAQTMVLSHCDSDGDAVKTSVPWMHMYRERRGDTGLRQAIARIHAEGRYGPKDDGFDEDNVLVCSGVSGAVTSVLSAWKSLHGGGGRRPRVALFVPYYTYHLEIAEGIFGPNGYEPVLIPMRVDAEAGCVLDHAATEQTLATRGADVIIFTNPHNPSGSTLSPSDLAWLETLVRTHRSTWFLSDDIYADMNYTQAASRTKEVHRSIHVAEADNLFVAYGFSKSLAVGSWRVGYLVLSKRMLEVVAKEHDRFYISAPWTQLAVAKYLNREAQDFDRFLEQWNRRLVHNADCLSSALEATLGWRRVAAQGGMYVLLRHNEASDWDAFRTALAIGVAVAPGSLFGMPTGYVRIHLAMQTEVARRMAEKLESQSAVRA
ncbi:hypothetical protein ACQY0O_006053 [Thecaphora frezii]